MGVSDFEQRTVTFRNMCIPERQVLICTHLRFEILLTRGWGVDYGPSGDAQVTECRFGSTIVVTARWSATHSIEATVGCPLSFTFASHLMATAHAKIERLGGEMGNEKVRAGSIRTVLDLLR